MYRIDVYSPIKRGNKKCTSHWYPSLVQAEIARNSIQSLPPKGCQSFLVNKRHPYYIVTKPVEDDKY